jgi:SAM-dependent methyltransferase
MFELLKKINRRPKPWQFYTADVLWNDGHISKKMLEFHLDENADPASRNKAFVDKSVAWITSRFNIGPGTRIGDFGCGPGLYATEFAKTGASVTGVDFSERSIRYARDTAKQKKLDIEYVLQNYLEYTTNMKFDLIALIYCDLCPLSPAQRRALIGKFYEYLNDGGCVLLDVFSLKAYEQRQESATHGHMLMNGFWSAEDYYGFLNTYKYDAEKVVLDKYTIVEKGRMWDVFNWLQYFSVKSLEKEFEDQGFRMIEIYSDVAGRPYASDSSEIAIVVAK